MKYKGSTKVNSRRKFIRNAGLAATGFYIVPRHVLGGKGFIAPSDKLLIAGIGAGGKGGDDQRHFAETGKAEIAFLCDVDDRQAAGNRKLFPKAKYYHDWRELFDKEHKHFDAVDVGIPDHNHAVVGFHAMQLGKHVYVQKPLTHDIWEARMMAEAEKRYKVVCQMGDQGASSDGLRQLREWYDAGIIGEVHTVYCWTDRPTWPQAKLWPQKNPAIPKELQWDLWQGTAMEREYEDGVLPFKWRGWWDYGTGSLGDMGCHIIGTVFKVLGLEYPSEVAATACTPYVGDWEEGYYPDSPPLSSYIQFRYEGKNNNGQEITLHWMDGGIKPPRPKELKPNEQFGGGRSGLLFIGTRGKMMCSTYGREPQLLPTSLTSQVKVPQKYSRVPGNYDGHYKQWVEACLAGYGNMEVDSPFVGYAGPLTESILIGNLALHSFNFREKKKNGNGYNGWNYPGRDITLEWDAQNMKVTNFERANQYVKRTYRKGWPELKF